MTLQLDPFASIHTPPHPTFLWTTMFTSHGWDVCSCSVFTLCLHYFSFGRFGQSNIKTLANLHSWLLLKYLQVCSIFLWCTLLYIYLFISKSMQYWLVVHIYTNAFTHYAGQGRCVGEHLLRIRSCVKLTIKLSR